MDETAMERIRERLLEERRARLTSLAELDDRYKARLEMGDDELTNYPLHMADEGTDTMEQEKEFLLASQDGRQLMEIDASLRMMYANPDEFGACERCGRDIAVERFELIPWARLCIGCQQDVEESAPGTGGP